MARLSRIALLCAAAIMFAAAPAAAEETYGLPLPPGTRPAEGGAFKSSRGLRDSVRFYERQLARRGIPHRALPLYRRRGVELARFLATDDESPWAAVHVYRYRGTTFIAIVGGPPLDLAH